MRLFITALILFSTIAASAYSDIQAVEPGALDQAERLILGYGATTLDKNGALGKKLWYEYRVKPRFHTRKVWLGLDLRFHIDEDSDLLIDDWNGFNDIIDKIDYLYFNTRKDPFYLRFGQLKEVTFGSGFVVNRYSNSISYPLKEKMVGLDIGLNLPYDDCIEYFVSDLDSAKLFGMRGSFVPLDLVNVGLSYVHDSDPARDGTGDGLSCLAVDVLTPVYKRKNSAFYIYENLAKMLDYGFGFSSGIKWEIPFGEINGEYRYYDSDFSPSYFNEYYELDSRRKYRDLRALQGGGKFGGYFVYTIFDLIKDRLSVRSSVERFTNSGRAVHFFTEFKLSNLPVENLNAKLTYDDKDSFLADFGFDKKNVAIVSEVNYSIAKHAVLKVDYKRLYDEFGTASKVSSVATEISF